MRSLSLALPLLLIATLAAGPALGAPGGGKAKKYYIPPPTPVAADGLRGPLGADAPESAFVAPSVSTESSFPATPPTPPALALPAPGEGLAALASTSAATARISPLKPVGDPAPVCRAECAKSRVTCSGSEDFECDSHWSQCVADCSVPTLH